MASNSCNQLHAKAGRGPGVRMRLSGPPSHESIDKVQQFNQGDRVAVMARLVAFSILGYGVAFAEEKLGPFLDSGVIGPTNNSLELRVKDC